MGAVWLDRQKRVGGRRRIRQWKYAFDSFHSLRGLWFTVIHIVSNLIWNNPGQGGVSVDREHETVLASLKRQRRCLEGGEQRVHRFRNYRQVVIKQTWPKKPDKDTLLCKWAYPHASTSTNTHRHFRWLIGLRLSPLSVVFVLFHLCGSLCLWWRHF